jgi:hypothetical protein
MTDISTKTCPPLYHNKQLYQTYNGNGLPKQKSTYLQLMRPMSFASIHLPIPEGAKQNRLAP